MDDGNVSSSASVEGEPRGSPRGPSSVSSGGMGGQGGVQLPRGPGSPCVTLLHMMEGRVSNRRGKLPGAAFLVARDANVAEKVMAALNGPDGIK